MLNGCTPAVTAWQIAAVPCVHAAHNAHRTKPIMSCAASSPMLVRHADAGVCTCILTGGVMTARCDWADGITCASTYHTSTGELLTRKWRAKVRVGHEPAWEVEFGEPGVAAGAGTAPSVRGIVSEAGGTPIVCPVDTHGAWEFRIHNLPYPIDTYSVTVDAEAQQLVLRTSNKKYFKRLYVPALYRAQLPLHQDAVSLAHSGTTLVIRYTKPETILAAEKRERDGVMAQMAAKRDGDVDCKTQ